METVAFITFAIALVAFMFYIWIALGSNDAENSTSSIPKPPNTIPTVNQVGGAHSTATGIELGEAAFEAGNFALALKEFKREAERGNCEGYVALGIMHAMGHGVPQSNKEAAMWFRKGAEQGHVESQYRLGMTYKDGGDGVPQDYKQAAAWCLLAADQGFAQAQFAMGFFYKIGKGVPQSDEQAVFWFRKAAKQDIASAQFHLGAAYNRGEGIRQSQKEAMYWFRKAADQGDAMAKMALNSMS
jgi:TPR repeat protein